MSGQVTSTSRGSSVGSSASSPSSTSRSTSTWRAGPWQACTCTLRSSVRSTRPGSPTALAATSDWSQPSRVSGRAAVGGLVGRLAARRPAACARARGRRGRGWRAAGARPRWEVASGRGTAVRSSSADQSAAEGCGNQRWTSRCSPSAARSSASVTGTRVWPNSESRSGRSLAAGSSRSARAPRGGAAPATPPAPRPPGGATARPATPGRPAAHHPLTGPVGVTPGLPAGQQRRALLGVVGEQAREAARHGVPPAAAQVALLAAPAVAEVGTQRAHQGSPRLASTTPSSGQTSASGAHGSSSGRARTSATSDRGERNSTPAQTPSSPTPAPRRCESRWLSQRSTPLAGTITSSEANGSASGLPSRSARPSTSRSARSARCTLNATRRP